MATEEAGSVNNGRSTVSSHQESARSREEYDSYENELMAKRARLQDPSQSLSTIHEAFSELDRLYHEHAERTSSAYVIETDQRAFGQVTGLVSARMSKQALGVRGEVTSSTFIESLQRQSTVARSGHAVLEAMGAYFSRASRLTVLPPAMPDFSQVSRQTVSRAPAPRIARPEGDAATADVVVGTRTEDAQQVELQKIHEYVRLDEEVNDYQPILLYQLCLNRHSFAETMENFFFVSVLVKEDRLWLGANKRGLPVVGTNENRAKYVAQAQQLGEPIAGPPVDQPQTSNSDVENSRDGSRSPNEHENSAHIAAGERNQFNWNFNYPLFMKLREFFPGEPLIPRRRESDSYDLHGRHHSH